MRSPCNSDMQGLPLSPIHTLYIFLELHGERLCFEVNHVHVRLAYNLGNVKVYADLS